MKYLSRKELDTAIKQTRQDLFELESHIGKESFLQIFEDYNPAEDDCPPWNLIFSLFQDFYCPYYSPEQHSAHFIADDYILSVWERHNSVAKLTKLRKWTLQTEWNRVRKDVLERDKYRCQDCGNHKGLCVHHIKPKAYFPDLTYEPSNLITLCKSCHVKRHPEKEALIMSNGNRKAVR